MDERHLLQVGEAAGLQRAGHPGEQGEQRGDEHRERETNPERHSRALARSQRQVVGRLARLELEVLRCDAAEGDAAPGDLVGGGASLRDGLGGLINGQDVAHVQTRRAGSGGRAPGPQPISRTQEPGCTGSVSTMARRHGESAVIVSAPHTVFQHRTDMTRRCCQRERPTASE